MGEKERGLRAAGKKCRGEVWGGGGSFKMTSGRDVCSNDRQCAKNESSCRLD